MPLLARQQQQKRKADEIAHANAPQQLSEPRHRPYLLKMLQDGLGTRVLADTLDWDGEFVRSSCPSRARGPPPLACAVPWGFVRKKSEISFS
jgi:hypothetical protein